MVVQVTIPTRDKPLLLFPFPSLNFPLVAPCLEPSKVTSDK